MKCDKTIDSLDRMAESTMRWLEGEEVTAYLDWDSRYFYVWFEPTWNFEDFCEEQGGHLLSMLSDLRHELEQIGVRRFYDLDSVNMLTKHSVVLWVRKGLRTELLIYGRCLWTAL